MDYAIYHLDGPNELPYLDDLLAVPEITGIQWVPGVQGPVTSDDKWLPVYQKIQAAGKNIVMDPPGKGLAKVLSTIESPGIYASTHFNSQIIADLSSRNGWGVLKESNPKIEEWCVKLNN